MKTSALIKCLEDSMKVNGDIDVVTNYEGGDELELLNENLLHVCKVYENPYDTALFKQPCEKTESTQELKVFVI